MEIALAKSARDPEPVVLPKSSLVPVGFARDEGMFPYSARSFPGYRLLSEYFAFPEKFLFCETLRPDSATAGPLWESAGSLPLPRSPTPRCLENKITKENFRLGVALPL